MTNLPVDDPTRTQVEFEELLSPILSMAYGTAVRLTRDRTEAEDLIQDAALLAYRAFASFQPGTNFKAWFFRILTNAFYSRHRKDKHEKDNISSEDLPALYLYTKTAEAGLHGQETDPASALMDKLDSEQVGAALEELPEEYRLVATLYFIEDFSYQQIAEVLGCPVGTVRSRLHRGRRMLQKRLWDVAAERGIVRALRSPAATTVADVLRGVGDGVAVQHVARPGFAHYGPTIGESKADSESS